MFYYLLKHALLGPFLRIVFRPRIEGLENVPEDGPAIIAGNHLSFSDHFLMPAMLRRRITFLAKQEYFTGPGLKGALIAAFFRGIGQIPVDRTGGSAARSAVREGVRVLRGGGLLGIYPEGTRSPDGKLYKGRTGVAVMALTAPARVVPCAMVGTFEMQPPGRILPRLHRVTIRFGEPLDFSRFEGLESDRFVLRSVADEIMYTVMELSGQEYVDRYATDVKAEAQAARSRRRGDRRAEGRTDRRSGRSTGGRADRRTDRPGGRGGSGGAGGSEGAQTSPGGTQPPPES